jgi:galactose mutarotase-like enzyme
MIDMLYRGATQKRTGIPLLFPHYRNAAGMRSHGFGRDSHWEASRVRDDTAVMRLTSEKVGRDVLQEFPYSFAATLTVQAGDDGSMTYDLQVLNTGDRDLPIAPGLHPYWAVNHDDKTKIRINGIEGFDATKIDPASGRSVWDVKPPDDAYPYNGKVEIHLPHVQVALQDISESGPAVKYIVVWSQTPQEADCNFLCVEPVCGLDNAINESPIRIPSGRGFDMKIRFEATFK